MRLTRIRSRRWRPSSADHARRPVLRHAWQPRFPAGGRFCDGDGRAAARRIPLIVTLYGERVLVMHGDALCTDDRAYQRLRATVRDADWQRPISRAVRRAAPRAGGCGTQSAARRIRRPGVRHRRRQPGQRRGGAARRPARHAAARAYPSPRHPSARAWTDARAPASCSAIGTPTAACCAGTRGGPELPARYPGSAARPCTVRAGMKAEHLVAAR